MTIKSKILLLEDSVSLLEIYNTRLLSEGFDVATATWGKDAIELAATFNPDLFMVDIMLPDMSGLEFIEKIKNVPAGQNAGFIVLTALEMKDMQQKAATLGVDDYLVKSEVSLEDIVNTVIEVLKRKKSS